MGTSKSRSNVVNLFYKFYFFDLNIFFTSSYWLYYTDFPYPSLPHPQIFHFVFFFFRPLKSHQAEQEIEDLCENNSIAEEEGIIHFHWEKIDLCFPWPVFRNVCILLVISWLHCSRIPAIKVQLMLNPVYINFWTQPKTDMNSVMKSLLLWLRKQTHVKQ